MSKKIVFVVTGLFLLALIAFLFFNNNGFMRRIKLSSQIDSLNTEIKNYNVEIENLRSEIDSLKTNLKKIEHVAREKYNFKKPNETVIDIEEQ